MHRYETHLHTCQSSACGHSTGAEHARYYKAMGYTGIIVTDHFFGGNTAASRQGPWEQRVNEFCAGYEDAKAEGDRIGLDVFFGWEETFEGDDYLVYGLDKAWLLAHPEVTSFGRREQFDAVHTAGGVVIQAHPFRCRDYIRRVHLGLTLVDGVEVANAGNDPISDYYALQYAREYGMFMTTGSDNHLSHEGSTLYGVETEDRLESIHDFVAMVRERRQPGLLAPESRFALPEDPVLPLECYVHNTADQPLRYHQDWLQDGPFAPWLAPGYLPWWMKEAPKP